MINTSNDPRVPRDNVASMRPIAAEPRVVLQRFKPIGSKGYDGL
ncbi:hypothetical protein ACT7DH_13590 [Bacillus pacificus]